MIFFQKKSDFYVALSNFVFRLMREPSRATGTSRLTGLRSLIKKKSVFFCKYECFVWVMDYQSEIVFDAEREVKTKMSDIFGVQGIPTLAVVNLEDNSIVTAERERL